MSSGGILICKDCKKQTTVSLHPSDQPDVCRSVSHPWLSKYLFVKEHNDHDVWCLSDALGYYQGYDFDKGLIRDDNQGFDKVDFSLNKTTHKINIDVTSTVPEILGLVSNLKKFLEEHAEDSHKIKVEVYDPDDKQTTVTDTPELIKVNKILALFNMKPLVNRGDQSVVDGGRITIGYNGKFIIEIHNFNNSGKGKWMETASEQRVFHYLLEYTTDRPEYLERIMEQL